MDEFETIKRLADDELIRRVHHGIREDRRVSALLLAHLGEMDARELHRDLGYESMFDYAIRALHMSDSEAGLRLYAARFARRFPAALGMLSRGELHLTAMKLLSPVLTEHNAELLNMACLKTKQELQLLIAKHCPQPDAPEIIRRVSARIPSENAATFGPAGDNPAAQSALWVADRAASAQPSNDHAQRDGESPNESNEPDAVRNHAPAARTLSSAAGQDSRVPPSAASAGVGSYVHGEENSSTRIPVVHTGQVPNREPVTPLSEGRFKIQFTASQRVRDLLQEAQDLYRNQLPSGDLEVIVERALVMLVATRKKELFAQTDKPRRTSIARTAALDASPVHSAAGSSVAVSAARATGDSTETSSAAKTQTSIETSSAARTSIEASSATRTATAPGKFATGSSGDSAIATSSLPLSATASASASPVFSSTVASAASFTRFGGVTSPEKTARSRHIPNEIKRRVFARDQGQCVFVGPTGERCGARGRLEFHHVHAFALGGATTESNIMLCCRTHNRLFAERDFSREHMERCIRASQAARSKGCGDRENTRVFQAAHAPAEKTL